MERSRRKTNGKTKLLGRYEVWQKPGWGWEGVTIL